MDIRYPRVEAYFRGPEGWLYQAHGPELEEGIGVPCLGVGVALGDIYEGVELGAPSIYNPICITQFATQAILFAMSRML